MTQYPGQKIVVVGAGLTGLALASYFIEKGAMVTLSEGALPVKIVAYGPEITLTASTDEFPTEAITGTVV